MSLFHQSWRLFMSNGTLAIALPLCLGLIVVICITVWYIARRYRRRGELHVHHRMLARFSDAGMDGAVADARSREGVAPKTPAEGQTRMSPSVSAPAAPLHVSPDPIRFGRVPVYEDDTAITSATPPARRADTPESLRNRLAERKRDDELWVGGPGMVISDASAVGGLSSRIRASQQDEDSARDGSRGSCRKISLEREKHTKTVEQRVQHTLGDASSASNNIEFALPVVSATLMGDASALKAGSSAGSAAEIRNLTVVVEPGASGDDEDLEDI